MPSTNIAPVVSEAFEMFARARRAVQRVFVPALDILPDGCTTLNSVAVANGGAATGNNAVSFICDGYLVGISASVETGAAADAASVSMSVAVDGVTALFQTGQGGTGFVPLAQLSGPTGAGLFRIMAPFRNQTAWQVQFKNVGSTSSVSVDVTFWYCNRSRPPLAPG
jgi:hypothetical protein